MFREVTSFFLALFIPCLAFAQGQPPQGIVSGKVLDGSNGQALEYAAVGLYKSVDSSLTTGAITNEKGQFELSVPYGSYYLKAEFIAYEPIIKPDITLNSNNTFQNVGTLTLQSATAELAEVEVTAEKNQMQVGLDKRVFNVNKSIASVGGTATDVLENVPSVTVDQDGNVGLRGSQNVRILIDGKQSGLTGAEVLKQLPANAIESVEVITNPSARYDSEGMAGIINIVLKKERNKGFNALVNAAAGWPHNHMGSINFNYRKSKFNLFGSVGANYQLNGARIINNRTLNLNGTVQKINQDGSFSYTDFGQDFRLGIDYFISPTATLIASGFYHHARAPIPSRFDYQFLDGNDVLQSTLVRTTDDLNIDNNFDYNLTFRKNFKREGQSLTADARYSTGELSNSMTVIQEYFNTDVTSSYKGPGQRTFTSEAQEGLVVQVDYIHPFGEKSKFELGGKSTNRMLDVPYGVEQENSEGNYIKLTQYSDHYLYDEMINAAYLIYGGGLEKLSWQAGVRAEQTIIGSTMLEKDTSFDKEYINLFPSAHVSYDLGKQHTMQLSYSRRINRPNFWTLNPFPRFFDPLSAFAGNPDLDPEYTDAYELSSLKYWKKSSLNINGYYRHVTGMHQRLRYVDLSTGAARVIPVNVGTGNFFGMEFIVSKDLFKILKLNASVNGYRSIVTGTAVTEDFRNDYYGVDSRLSAQLKLPKDLEFMFSGNYNTPRPTAQGDFLAIYFFDLGVRKSILKKNGTLNLRFSDVLNTRGFRAITDEEDFYYYVEYKPMTQRVILSFTYRINNFRPQERRRDDYNGGGGEIGF